MNLDSLEPEERKEAIKILAALGLCPDDVTRLQQSLPKARPRPKEKQQEYILRREVTCLLCHTQVSCFFKMLQRKSALQGTKLILSSELIDSTLNVVTTEHQVLTCPNCQKQLSALNKDELIQLLIEARNPIKVQNKTKETSDEN